MLIDLCGILYHNLFVEKLCRMIEFQTGITYIILELEFQYVITIKTFYLVTYFSF